MRWFDDLDDGEKLVVVTAIVQYGGIILLFLVAALVFWLAG